MGRWRSPSAARARAAAAALLFLITGACGRFGPGAVAGQVPGASASATGRGTLTVAVSSDFPTLDPARAADTESISAVQLMYESLFTYDAAGHVVGLLARDWTWSADHLTLTVKLNPAATFADGTPVTASDVVFSLERMLSKTIDSPQALDFADLVGFAQMRGSRPGALLTVPAASSASAAGAGTLGIAATGPETVTFELTQPLPYLPELLAMPSASIVEASLANSAAADGPAWWFAHSAGSGPYVLGSSNPGTSLQLATNPHYWRQGAADGAAPEGPYAAIDFEIVSSPAQQLKLFDAGKLDLLSPAPPTAAGAGLPAGSRLVQGQDLGVVYLGFNVAQPPFNNPLLRQAVAYALDKASLVAVAGAAGGPAAGLLPPGIPGFDPQLQPYPYDPQKARALFAESGAQPGLPVTLLTIRAGGTVQQGLTDGTAAAVERNLDAVGFNVTLQEDSWTQYYKDLAAGKENLFQGDWLADYPDAQDFFFNLLDSASIGSGNASFYSNPAFDSALATAAADTVPADQVRRYRQIDDLVYNDLPLVPEFYTEASVLLQPWVGPAPGTAPDVYMRPPLLPQLDRVWLLPQSPAGS